MDGLKFNVLLLIYLFIILGSAFTRGFYSFSGILLLTLSFILLFVFWVSGEKKFTFFNIGKPNFLLWFVFTLSIFLSLLLYGGLYQASSFLIHFSRWLLFFLLLLSFTIPFLPSTRLASWSRFFFLIFFLTGIILKIFLVISSPNPRIDTYSFLLHGIRGLFAGQNPYQMIFPQIYRGVVPDYFGYFPGSLIFLSPFVLLLGDPRFGLIFFDVIFVLVISFLIRSVRSDRQFLSEFSRNFFLPLLFFFHPMSLYILEQSYIDIIILALLGIMVYLTVRKYSFLATAIIVAAIMSVKQTFLVLPLFLNPINKRIVRFSPYFFWLIIISLFVLWSPKDFFSDTISFHFQYPIRHDGLTINSFFFSSVGRDIPQIIFFLSWVILFLVLFLKQKVSLENLFIRMSLWFFGFFLFNKLAFVNYYYFINGLLLLALVCLLLRR